MFQQDKVAKFTIEHGMQVYYKVLQGLYVATFTNKQGNKKYGYIRYNQQNNQILKP